MGMTNVVECVDDDALCLKFCENTLDINGDAEDTLEGIGRGVLGNVSQLHICGQFQRIYSRDGYVPQGNASRGAPPRTKSQDEASN